MGRALRWPRGHARAHHGPVRRHAASSHADGHSLPARHGLHRRPLARQALRLCGAHRERARVRAHLLRRLRGARSRPLPALPPLPALSSSAPLTTHVIRLLPPHPPRMATPSIAADSAPLLEAPGFLLLNYGRATPVVTILGHLAYGAIVGLFVSAAAR